MVLGCKLAGSSIPGEEPGAQETAAGERALPGLDLSETLWSERSVCSQQVRMRERNTPRPGLGSLRNKVRLGELFLSSVGIVLGETPMSLPGC